MRIAAPRALTALVALDGAFRGLAPAASRHGWTQQQLDAFQMVVVAHAEAPRGLMPEIFNAIKTFQAEHPRVKSFRWEEPRKVGEPRKIRSFRRTARTPRAPNGAAGAGAGAGRVVPPGRGGKR